MNRSWVLIGIIGCWGLTVGAYDPKDRRDPFVALVTPDGVLREPRVPKSKAGSRIQGELALEGVVYDPRGGSVVVINGEVFQVGDVREGIEVLKIEPTRVVVLRNGAEQELRLPVLPEDEGGP